MSKRKTYGSMFKADYYSDNVRLVVCQKSKINDWIDDLKEFYDDRVQIYNLADKKGFKAYSEGLQKDKINYLVINYDIVWRRDLSKLKNFTMILDESSEIKHKTTKKTKAILKLSNSSSHNILLSGTPCGGKYELMVTQCNLLGWNLSEKDFYDVYCEWFYNYNIATIPIKQIRWYKHIETSFKPNLKSYGAEFIKTEDHHDLPERIEKTIFSKRPTEYNKFHKKSILCTKDKEWVGETSLTQMLYERMILGIYDKEKQNSLQDIINSTSRRVVVFYNFKEEIKMFLNLIKDRPISVVNGSTKDLENYEKKQNSVTFVQYQAGAKGLNLQKANYMVFYTPPLSAELYAQAKKRIHRVGQKHTCYYYKLVTKDSVEEKIYSALNKGINYELKLFEKDYLTK